MTIGINLWFIPQISEHWPKNTPGRFIDRRVWFNRPGVESILIPREGTVQEWITSIEVVNKRIGSLNGIIHRLSTSNNRNLFSSIVFWGTINESKFRLGKSEYSYLQYHWWPIALTVILQLLISSVKYKILIDGIAIKIKIIIGVIVQINSIVWPWSKNRSINLFFIINIIMKKINKVIKRRISIVKSWKKIIISYTGELEFWRDRFQVLIFNKRRIFFINES